MFELFILDLKEIFNKDDDSNEAKILQELKKEKKAIKNKVLIEIKKKEIEQLKKKYGLK